MVFDTATILEEVSLAGLEASCSEIVVTSLEATLGFDATGLVFLISTATDLGSSIGVTRQVTLRV